MTKAFGGQLLGEGLASRAMGFFLTVSSQTSYTNIVYTITHDSNRLPFSWPLIIHSFLKRFVRDDWICNDHCVVKSMRIKQSSNEIDFTELLDDMACL